MSRAVIVQRPSEAGMTLVEILTVVFIIGLTSSLVILTLPEPISDEQKFVDRFAQNVRQASDRAILTGRVQGIDFGDRGYELTEWRERAWITRRQGPERQLQNVQLRLKGVSSEPEEGVPDLVFDPTGVNEPVSIDVRIGRAQYGLTISASGVVRRED